jgi:hypothetical protein
MEIAPDFVVEDIAGSSPPGPGGVAALDHEVGKHPVKGGIIVEALRRQEHEVIDGVRHILRKKVQHHRAFFGLHDGPVLLGLIDHHFRRLVPLHLLALPCLW